MASLLEVSLGYPTTKAIVDNLSHHLAHPGGPTSCQGCLVFCAITLNGRLAEHLPRLRLECHSFFDACVAVLIARRTPDELERTAGRLADGQGLCRIHRSDRNVRVQSPDSHLHILFQSAASIFTAAVHSGELSVARRTLRAGKAFSDKHGRWPARVDQLFPHGVRAAVDGLLANCELYLSEGPVSALGVMVDIARPVIMPVLVSEPFRTRLVEVVLKMLDPVASGLLERAPWLTDSQLSLRKTVYLLEAMIIGPASHTVAGFFAGREDALLGTIASVTETMEDDDPLLESLSLWCNALVRHSGRTMPPRMQRWLAAQDSGASADCKHSAAHTLHQYIFALATSRVCAGPGCTLVALQRPFAACARCRTPRYCTRACQRADWKGEGDALLPHKTICRVLSRFAAKQESDLPEFIELYERVEGDFDDADVDTIRALIEATCARYHSRAANNSVDG